MTSYWLGKKNPEHSKRMKGRHVSSKTEFKKGQVGINKGKKIPKLAKFGKDNPFFGKKHTKESIKKMSEIKRGKTFTTTHKEKISTALRGENNGAWLGGISFEPYGFEFNEILKKIIRKRDKYICKLCGKTQQQNRKKLDIHHIDYNKKNNNPNNLISLCRSCHGKTTTERRDWIKYFKENIQ